MHSQKRWEEEKARYPQPYEKGSEYNPRKRETSLDRIDQRKRRNDSPGDRSQINDSSSSKSRESFSIRGAAQRESVRSFSDVRSSNEEAPRDYKNYRDSSYVRGGRDSNGREPRDFTAESKSDAIPLGPRRIAGIAERNAGSRDFKDNASDNRIRQTDRSDSRDTRTVPRGSVKVKEDSFESSREFRDLRERRTPELTRDGRGSNADSKNQRYIESTSDLPDKIERRPSRVLDDRGSSRFEENRESRDIRSGRERSSERDNIRRDSRSYVPSDSTSRKSSIREPIRSRESEGNYYRPSRVDSRDDRNLDAKERQRSRNRSHDARDKDSPSREIEMREKDRPNRDSEMKDQDRSVQLRRKFSERSGDSDNRRSSADFVELSSLANVKTAPNSSERPSNPENNSSDVKLSAASVMDTLSVEEKARQRKERVEKWRKERQSKESSEPVIESVASEAVPEIKPWSFEDEEEDDELPLPFVEFVESIAPPLAPLIQQEDEEMPLAQNLSNVKTKSTVTFGKSFGPGIKPITAANPFESTETAAVVVPQAADDDDDDPLDKFMLNVVQEVTSIDQVPNIKDPNAILFETNEYIRDRRPVNEDEAEINLIMGVGTQEDDPFAAAARAMMPKKKEWSEIDHSTIDYPPFKKDFYIEPSDISDLTEPEVEIKRIEMGGIKIHGKDCPKPVERWAQLGLPPGVGEVIRRGLKYDKPTSIQCQAIPAVMSGRDVIGIAKTGSGKTLAFLLPMFRHIRDQPPVRQGEGPIALIMTPTRELAVQIQRECRHFIKSLNIRSLCCTGGPPIKDQISELKKGTEIVICTPGRMIDLLCANNGKVTTLKRVTYLVLDEADRMFDMGFEPQVMKMILNIRPDRQTILFSATFPRKMEALARKVLKNPLEIVVGGRSTVCSDVEQIVEVRDDDTKFMRLLEILGDCFAYNPLAKALIFVDRHDACDLLLKELFKYGYPCQSLHGGKDQLDRQCTFADFKAGNINIVIATSVAARGLDVKNLAVVVNYECPNHMEDYVHRCGRTGRAGNKGKAFTFICPDQEKYAVDILQALKLSNVPVPKELQKLADNFIKKVKAGTAQYGSSGFSGKGLAKLDKERDIVKSYQKKTHGMGLGEDDSDDEKTDDEAVKALLGGSKSVKQPEANTLERKEGIEKIARAQAESIVEAGSIPTSLGTEVDKSIIHKRAKEATERVGKEGLSKAMMVLKGLNEKIESALKAPGGVASVFKSKMQEKSGAEAPHSCEIEVNDYAQQTRWKVTSKDTINAITHSTGAAITIRGQFIERGRTPRIGERKLFLFIEGETQNQVDRAKKEIKRVLYETSLQLSEAEGSLGSFASRFLITE